jgi:uncharacterized membrane protein
MSAVEHEVVVNVPVDAVYAALLRIADVPRWMVGLEEVRNLTGLGVGDSFDWTFKMAGKLTFRGRTTFTAMEPNRYLREDGTGDLTDAWEWWLTPEMSGTRVRVRIEYVVPGGSVLGAIADKLFVERQNQRDLEQSIANLKQILEG